MSTTATASPAVQPYVPLRPPGFKTRRPTGRVAWPMLLLEGEEKAGKSTKAVELTASPRIGQSFMIAFGEAHADEYGAIPGADYEIIPFDGTYSDLLRQIEFVRQIAEHANAHGQPPVLLIIDSMVFVWKLLQNWTYERAKQSKEGKAKLAQDPDAEINPGRNLWNDANARHANLVAALRRIPGIVVLTGRGKWVSATNPATGQPINGVKEYTLETQKGLGFEVSCWVRMFREEPDQLVGLTSANPKIRRNAKKDRAMRLPDDWSLEWLIFEYMGFDPGTAQVPAITMPKTDRSPEEIRAEVMNPATPWPRLTQLQTEASPYAGVIVADERGNDITLGDLITRVMNARAVSDPALVAELEKALSTAETVDALAKAGQRVAAAIEQGKVSAADRARLSTIYQTRMSALRAAQAAAPAAGDEAAGDEAAQNEVTQ